MRVAILIDGGHLRVLARRAGYEYNPEYIERIAHSCISDGEHLLRILYYDCAPYQGTVRLPVSGESHTFEGSDKWLRDLAERDLFAVRRGVLKFRGFKPKKIPIAPEILRDDHFKPDFEQKGVDMRIGLDMANLSMSKAVERIILITADTDCIPSMKHARIHGLQVALVAFPDRRVAPELYWHADFKRRVVWPD